MREPHDHDRPGDRGGDAASIREPEASKCGVASALGVTHANSVAGDRKSYVIVT
jgi:hypothetical protein